MKNKAIIRMLCLIPAAALTLTLNAQKTFPVMATPKPATSESISLTVLTYNTHLFGELATFKMADMVPGEIMPSPLDIKDLLWEDEARKQRLKDYLITKPADIVMLQELWSGAYANNIKHDERTENIYPNFYAPDAHHGEMNNGGLAVLSAPGIVITSMEFTNLIKSCDKNGFGIQDKFSGKGFVQLTAEITSEFDPRIPDGKSIRAGVFTTHTMTNQSKYKESAACFFDAMATAVKKFRVANPGAIVLFSGDLNVQLFKEDDKGGIDQTKYNTTVKAKLLVPETGLASAYDARRQLSGKSVLEDPGITMDGPNNSVVQHFDKGSTSRACIDYIFYASSKDNATTVNVRSAGDVQVITNLKTSAGIDVSDHYPLKATFSISNSSLRTPRPKYTWADAGEIKATSDPTTESYGALSVAKDAGAGKVIVGVGGKVKDNNFHTLALMVASIDELGNIGTVTVERRYGQASDEPLEVAGKVGLQEVVVGVGLRVSGSNLKTMALYGRRLDPATGRLTGEIREYRFGTEPNGNLEVKWIAPASDLRMITGVGVRAKDNNMKGLVLTTGQFKTANALIQAPKPKYTWIDAGEIKATSDPTTETYGYLTTSSDALAGNVIVGIGGKVMNNNFNTLALIVASIDEKGNIGPAVEERRFGQAPNEPFEAVGKVGPQEVLVGVGFRVSDSNLKTMALYGRRLDPATGKLTGDIREYRFGNDPNGNLEVKWIVPVNDLRMVTGVGVRAKDNNMKGLVLKTGQFR